MSQRVRFWAAIVLCAAFAACSQSGSGETAQGGRQNAWTVPHVLRYATAEDISNLNPHLAQQTTLGLMSSLTMAWLIRWDVHNRPYPELATEVPTIHNGGVSKDGLTITYHLRKGVKWSDGAPFDADDVVFSTNVVNNPANNEVGRAGWDKIVKIDEPDKYTVVYHLKSPYSPFLVTFFSSAGANPCILPKHLLAQYPNINNVAYNSLPVGIGPFMYKEWDRATKVVMVANPLYWRGQPKLKEIDFMIVPNRSTVMTQIQGHELDMWYPVPGAYYVQLRNLTGYTAVKLPAYYFNHIDFNTSSTKLRDPAVRRALLFALDRRTLFEKINRNIGYLQDEPAPRTAPYWDPKIGFTAFDIPKANQLLDQVGWRRGADGIRAKEGSRLALNFATSVGAPDVDREIELIRTWWKQIGVDLTVQHYPPNQLFAPLKADGVLYNPKKWDVATFAWGLDPQGDFSPLYSCKSLPPAGQNDLRWCNSRAQGAMDAFYTHYDQADENKDDEITMKELQKEVPMIVTTAREDIWVVNSDLKSFTPNGVSQFDNMMDTDI